MEVFGCHIFNDTKHTVGYEQTVHKLSKMHTVFHMGQYLMIISNLDIQYSTKIEEILKRRSLPSSNYCYYFIHSWYDCFCYLQSFFQFFILSVKALMWL